MSTVLETSTSGLIRTLGGSAPINGKGNTKKASHKTAPIAPVLDESSADEGICERFRCIHLRALTNSQLLMDNLKLLVSFSLFYRNRKYLLKAANKVVKGHLITDQFASEDNMNYAKSLKSKLERVPMPYCFDCETFAGHLMSCLHCSHCSYCNINNDPQWNTDMYGEAGESLSHARSHFIQMSHFFALNLGTCKVYCHACQEYLPTKRSFNQSLEEIALSRLFEAEHCRFKNSLSWATNVLRKPLKSSYVSFPVKQVKLIPYVPSNPGASEALLLSRGVRGLFNLGNTCFMNCILQASVHNKLLQNYFLSHHHTPSKCRMRSSKQACLACELASLFCKFFDGSVSKVPISPHEFLQAIWMSSREMAGYEQQDAHEFFICVMNGVHNSCCFGQKENHLSCDCVVHRVFGGLLESNVTCTSCGNVTSTFDPFFDISLDFRKEKNNVNSPAITENPFAAESLDWSRKDSGVKTHSLVDCLKRYTQPEILGSNAYICSSCKSHQVCTKQLSIRKLPPILCLHLKRFEHSVSATKIDAPIRFPTELCLTPFMTETLRSGNGDDNGADDMDNIWDGTQSILNSYQLFAVITHVGTMETGHYTAYICQNMEDWYHLDDQVVTPASVREVLGSHAYMLYYGKKTIVSS